MSSGATSSLFSTLVEARSDDVVGHGEVLPMAAYTGETTAEIESALRERLVPALEDRSLGGMEDAHRSMDQAIHGQRLSEGEVDVALHGLMAARADVPVGTLPDARLRSEGDVAWAIGCGDAKCVVEEVIRQNTAGHRHIKLEGGRDAEGDLLLVRELVAAFDGGAETTLDAGGGDSGYRARRMLGLSASAGMDIVEQPLLRHDRRRMSDRAAELPTVVLADESVQSVTDADRLVIERSADAVSIKVHTVGVLRREHQIAATAADLGGSLEVVTMPVLGVATLDEARALPASQTGPGSLSRPSRTSTTSAGRWNSVLRRSIWQMLKRTPCLSVEILSKVFNPVGARGPNESRLSRGCILVGADDTVSRLRTDYVDVFQARRNDLSTPLEDRSQAFADLARHGRALYVGLSEWRAQQLKHDQEFARKETIALVSNHPQYSMSSRIIEADAVPVSRDLGIGWTLLSASAQGVLSGEFLPSPAPSVSSRGAANVQRQEPLLAIFMREDALAVVQRSRPIANECRLSIPQLLMAWVLQNDDVSAAIVGASRPEELRDRSGAGESCWTKRTMSCVDTPDGVVITDPALNEQMTLHWSCPAQSTN